MRERKCIVTRQSGSSQEMIRFCAAPDGTLVPDLKARLPGRGAWIVAERAILEKALAKNNFAHALKQEIVIPEGLADTVDALLLKSAVQALAIARKGGAVTTGAAQVEEAVRKGQASVVLHASEAAQDGRRKIAQAIFATQKLYGRDPVTNPATIDIFSGDDLAQIWGTKNVIHIAITKGEAAKGFIDRLKKLLRYRGINDMNLIEEKHVDDMV